MATWERLVEVAQELGPDPDLVEVSTADLVASVGTQAVALARSQARWIVLLAEIVTRGVWAEQGAKSPGQWLSWAVGLSPSAARDHVRVGLALRGLPALRAAFLSGRVSYSKVRAVTRLGHAETEDVLLAWCDAAPAAELEKIVAATTRSCRVDGIEADPFAADPTDPSLEENRAERFGVVSTGDGTVELRLRMDEADGQRVAAQIRWLACQQDSGLPFGAQAVAAVLAAIGAAMRHVPADESGQDRDRLVVQVAATLVAEADGGSAEAGDPGRDPKTGSDDDRDGDSAEALVDRRRASSVAGPGRLRLVPSVAPGRGRPAMGLRTLRRLACDAEVIVVTTTGRRRPLDVGRSQRLVTAKQRRALLVRDPSCRFPGCDSAESLHAHHAVEWEAGGNTDLDNLVHLCGFHHRFVHRAGWRVEPLGEGRFLFRDAEGRPFHARAEVDLGQGPRAASAEAAALAGPPAVDRPDELQPCAWDGSSVDWSLCVAVLRQALDRRPGPPGDGRDRGGGSGLAEVA